MDLKRKREGQRGRERKGERKHNKYIRNEKRNTIRNIVCILKSQVKSMNEFMLINLKIYIK